LMNTKLFILTLLCWSLTQSLIVFSSHKNLTNKLTESKTTRLDASLANNKVSKRGRYLYVYRDRDCQVGGRIISGGTGCDIVNSPVNLLGFKGVSLHVAFPWRDTYVRLVAWSAPYCDKDFRFADFQDNKCIVSNSSEPILTITEDGYTYTYYSARGTW
jgi:hypothetical protein